MCVLGTTVEDHFPGLGLAVKREDLCCPLGPHFSKTRGVYAHIAKRPEKIIGVLDTSHSQGGWAVAQACKLLNKHCILYYPVRKVDRDKTLDWDPTGRGAWGDVLKPQQAVAEELGATLIPLAAGRSAVLYHQAKRDLSAETGAGESYMMPNALKLIETVTETAAEFERTELPDVSTIVVSASSATIASGVYVGALKAGWCGRIIVHMGYSRPKVAVLRYIQHYAAELGGGGLFDPTSSSGGEIKLSIIDEQYGYGDEAKPGPIPPFPCNTFYDLKAFRWWMRDGRKRLGRAFLWNIG